MVQRRPSKGAEVIKALFLAVLVILWAPTLAASPSAKSKASGATAATTSLALPKRNVSHLDAPITIDVDPDAGVVRVKSFPMVSGESTLVASFQTNGKKSQLLRVNDPVTIHIASQPAHVAKFSLENQPSTSFEVDGLPVSATKTVWSVTEYRTGEVREDFEITVTAATFVRLATANVVVIRIADERLAVEPEALKTMHEMAARIDKKLLTATVQARSAYEMMKRAFDEAVSPADKRLMAGAFVMAKVEPGFTTDRDVAKIMSRPSDRTTTLSTGERKLIYEQEGLTFLIEKNGVLKDLSYAVEPIP
jgi:hypothetical protein